MLSLNYQNQTSLNYASNHIDSALNYTNSRNSKITVLNNDKTSNSLGYPYNNTVSNNILHTSDSAEKNSSYGSGFSIDHVRYYVEGVTLVPLSTFGMFGKYSQKIHGYKSEYVNFSMISRKVESNILLLFFSKFSLHGGLDETRNENRLQSSVGWTVRI